MEGVNVKNSPSRKRKIPNWQPRRPLKSEDIGRQAGWEPDVYVYTIDVMEMFISNNRHGIVPRRQVGTVPGQHGPYHVTGTSDSRHEAGMGQGRATSYTIRKLHWNAEGVRNKNLELQALLNERNIDVCCIQETHLNSCDPFSIRGFRRDRTDRTQGGILTLVKNTHAAAEVYRSEDEDT